MYCSNNPLLSSLPYFSQIFPTPTPKSIIEKRRQRQASPWQVPSSLLKSTIGRLQYAPAKRVQHCRFQTPTHSAGSLVPANLCRKCIIVESPKASSACGKAGASIVIMNACADMFSYSHLGLTANVGDCGSLHSRWLYLKFSLYLNLRRRLVFCLLW